MTPQNAQATVGYIAPKPMRKGFLGMQRPQAETSVIKGADGARYMFIVTSNAYKDREGETITTEALRRYVAASWPAEDKCLPNNKHLYWHDDALHIGDIVWCDTEGPFLIELSKERHGTFTHRGQEYPVSALWDYFERTNEKQGASHRFRYLTGDRADGTYEWILKEETTTLPLKAAANQYTFSGVIDMSQKDKTLDAILGVTGAAEKLREAPKQLEAALTELGLEHKSMTPPPVPPPAKTDAAPDKAEAAPQASSEAAQLTDLVMSVLIANNQQPAETVKAALLKAISEAIVSEDAAPEAAPAAPLPPQAKAYAQTDSIGRVDTEVATRELTDLTAQLTDSQAVLVTAQKGIEDTQRQTVEALKALTAQLTALATLPTAIDALAGRVGAVEKRMGGAPRIASSDPATALDPDSPIAKQVQDDLIEYVTVLGLPLKKQA